MDNILPNEIRVLALDPSPEGLGFVVLEGPERLIDWGVKSVHPEDKNGQCLRIAADLIDRNRPHAIVLEDTSGEDSRRHERVKELLSRLTQLARQKRVRLATFSPTRVHWAFRPRKDVVAAALAGRFPELAPRLPSPRKCGDSEHAAMPLFDAAALAAAYFYFRNRVKLAEERKLWKSALARPERGRAR